jgi:hypothetical protein
VEYNQHSVEIDVISELYEVEIDTVNRIAKLGIGISMYINASFIYDTKEEYARLLNVESVHL